MNISYGYTQSEVRNGVITLIKTEYINSQHSISLSKNIKNTSLSLNLSKSDYNDKTNQASDSKTTYYNFTSNSHVGKNLTINTGVAISKTAILLNLSSKSNLYTFSIANNPSNGIFSFSFNGNYNITNQSGVDYKSLSLNLRNEFQIVPSKWSVSLENNLSGTKDSIKTSNNKTLLTIVNLNRYYEPNSTLSLEYKRTDFKDNLDSANDYKTNLISVRNMMKF